ncbi:helix-turn-helix transcriptional regulator [Chakrabartyella piscis]|uniref:helix-turn-helix domain-containing protein n=1 Tax=Chakrabartyella piscis TaxID=2918914 RepID=UPI00295854AA|nr:helix-turn-helix transcriptional regulator [Chakrabartyella piscis]
MTFPERLKELRKEKNMTQKKLAELLSYGSSAISNYEKDNTKPSIDDVIKISKIFDVSLDYLLCVVDIRTPAIKFMDAETSEYMELLNTLNADQKKEALLMLQWVSTKETPSSYGNKKPASSLLRVAQDKTDYKTE